MRNWIKGFVLMISLGALTGCPTLLTEDELRGVWTGNQPYVGETTWAFDGDRYYCEDSRDKFGGRFRLSPDGPSTRFTFTIMWLILSNGEVITAEEELPVLHGFIDLEEGVLRIWYGHLSEEHYSFEEAESGITLENCWNCIEQWPSNVPWGPTPPVTKPLLSQ